MASNEHVDLRKIENFVRSKCHPEDTSKDKGKKDAQLRRVVFESYRKLLKTTIAPHFTEIYYSIMMFELQTKKSIKIL